MLVEMTPGKPVTCSEHGVLSPPSGDEAALQLVNGIISALRVRAEAGVPERLVAAVTALMHLRDVHGKDVDGAIRKVLEEVKREAQNT
jgi:hypothetical protein